MPSDILAGGVVFSSEAKKTLTFTFILCFVCALILSTLSTVLQAPQQKARLLDQSQQLLLAAQILNYNGSFQIKGEYGTYIPAKFDGKKLVPDTQFSKASSSDTLSLYREMIHPMLTNDQGDLITFADANIDYETYVKKYQKKGYADLPEKLLYVVGDGEGYVISINGFGLWDAIYGYLAIDADADTVIGTTWYSQAETAGLGANIALPQWQMQFKGKLIFQPSSNGTTDFDRAPLGITVVKGNVVDTLGTGPKSYSAVDGISGATLTGKGVTDAFTNSLAPYRPFLLRVRK
jgi:Na+-transporting NADH:ubiquinone oxidoreductase subunit C